MDILKADGNAREVVKNLSDLIHSKVPLAGARAFGIVHTCLTGPFQAAFDKVCDNIFDMIPHYIQLRAALEEFSDDASDLFHHPRSVLPGIPMHHSKYTEELFKDTSDVELDALTILAVQLILKNHLILFERQAEMYLPGGEHAEGKDREVVRNCPLTNRASESNMGKLDKQIKLRPNATPGFIEAKVIVTPDSLKDIDKLFEKAFTVAWRYAGECTEENKKKLREYKASLRAIINRKKEIKKGKEVRNVVSRAKMVTEISRFGHEWRTCTEIEEKYKQLESMSEKKAAVTAQIRYHKIVLNTHKILPKDKMHLFVIKGNTIIQLKNNLKEIVANSPHYEHLANIYDDETRITGLTMLTSAEREK